MCAADQTPPKETSAAQTGTSIQTAIANSWLNNANKIGPDGTEKNDVTSWIESTDPYTGITNKIPQFTTTTTLSAKNQAIKDQNDASKFNLAQYGNEQTSGLLALGAKPFDYTSGDHEKWAGGLYDQLNSESNASNSEALRTQLSNQGIKMGSAAYDSAIRGQQRAQMDSRNQFLLGSNQQGYQQRLQTRNQRFNEPLAIASGTQIQNPQFGNFNGQQIPTTDNAGIINSYDKARADAANANSASWGSAFAGAMKLGGMFGLSDENAKKDITTIGTAKNGIPLKTFRYKGEPDSAPLRMGVMAQDVEKKNPRAVKVHSSGYKMVDYSKAMKMGA